MRIALDAMGTDTAPHSEIAGAIDALRDADTDLEVVLVGDRATIEDELSNYPDFPRDRLSVVHAPDRVSADESPAKALRRKPQSSIAVGVELHRTGEVGAFISAGSTGAVMAASLLILRPIEGVDRPAIGTVIPTAKGPLLLLDAGANVDCKPQQLLQFARLGNVYAQDVMGVQEPRIGLLNIGEEPGKGNDVAVAAYGLLAGSDLAFVGNVEGHEIIEGVCDVLVCDGFAGNILLKFYESVASFTVGLLTHAIGGEFKANDDLDRIFRLLDYTETGGAQLLGVNGVAIICHGGSPPKAIRNAIHVAARAVTSSMVEHFERELSSGSPA